MDDLAALTWDELLARAAPCMTLPDLERHTRYNAHHGKGGRFASGSRGGVRASLMGASTTDEVSAVVASEASAVMGHRVRVNMAGSDVQIAREHGEGILQGVERFPNSRLSQVDTYGPGGARRTHVGDPDGDSIAMTTSGRYSKNEDTISFNTKYAGDPPLYQHTLSYSGKAGYLAVATPTGGALHEYGHVVTYHDNVADKAGSLAYSVAKSSPQHITTSNLVKREISGYASSSDHEMVAEVFADVMVNGGQAAPLSQKIFDVIDADYQQNGARR